MSLEYGSAEDQEYRRRHATQIANMILEHDTFLDDGPLPRPEESMAIHHPDNHGFGAFGEESVVFEFVVSTKPDKILLGKYCRVDSFVKLEGGAGLTFGDYIHVASFVHLNIGGGALVIGDHAAFASGSKVITGGNRPEGQSMSAASPLEMQVLSPREVVIGDYVCLATNAIVLPGVKVGEGAVLGAGAVATKDLKPWTVYVAGTRGPNGYNGAVELGPRPRPWMEGK
jgi:acetyltransferase-like isoleucine patch superfamily enzyme